MIEFIGSDTRIRPREIATLSECTPSNISGTTIHEAPQLISWDGITRIPDEAIELQLALGLGSGIALTIASAQTGAAVASLAGRNIAAIIKVISWIGGPALAMKVAVDKKAADALDKEARLKEYKESLEKAVESQESKDRKYGKPTMEA